MGRDIFSHEEIILADPVYADDEPVSADLLHGADHYFQLIRKLRHAGYQNISPDPEGSFYQEFVSELSTYPTTYLVDSEGNIIGAPIAGNVKKQKDTIQQRIDKILNP